MSRVFAFVNVGTESIAWKDGFIVWTGQDNLKSHNRVQLVSDIIIIKTEVFCDLSYYMDGGIVIPLPPGKKALLMI